MLFAFSKQFGNICVFATLIVCLGCSSGSTNDVSTSDASTNQDAPVPPVRSQDVDSAVSSDPLLNPTVNKFEKVIQSLAEGTPSAETNAAIELIGSSGVEAFDTLVAHLEDRTPASYNHFARAMITVDKDGNHRAYEPTIGDACFDLLQGQIEGNWAKGCRDYYVLTHANIRDWLAARNGKTLHELRLECARLSLEAARREHESEPREITQSCVDFLTENLARVEAEK